MLERIQHKYCPRPMQGLDTLQSRERVSYHHVALFPCEKIRHYLHHLHLHCHHYQRPCHRNPRSRITFSTTTTTTITSSTITVVALPETIVMIATIATRSPSPSAKTNKTSGKRSREKRDLRTDERPDGRTERTLVILGRSFRWRASIERRR